MPSDDHLARQNATIRASKVRNRFERRCVVLLLGVAMREWYRTSVRRIYVKYEYTHT